jgi:hypothetical protein
MKLPTLLEVAVLLGVSIALGLLSALANNAWGPAAEDITREDIGEVVIK